MPRTVVCNFSIWIVLTGSAAFGQVIADPQSSEPGAIIGYRPTTNLRDPSDRYVPVRLADPARVQPKGERHITETPEQQAARLAQIGRAHV